MNDHELRARRSRTGAPVPHPYSPDLESLRQSVLATLTDMDSQYERKRETLSVDLPEGLAKSRVLATLKVRHHERRQPYLQQLATLQGRLHSQQD